MKVDIFIRPQESPIKIVEDNLVRLYYNGQWIDFKDGKISVVFEDPQKHHNWGLGPPEPPRPKNYYPVA